MSAFDKKEQLSLIPLTFFWNSFQMSKKSGDYFVFNLITNCHQANNPKSSVINDCVVEFGDFPKGHLMNER